MNKNPLFCKYFLLSLIITVTLGNSFNRAFADSLNESSPNGRITIEFSLVDGKPSYAVKLDAKPIVEPSLMGFVLNDNVSLGKDFRIISSNQREVQEDWQQPWGECREVTCHYKELSVQLETSSEHKLNIVFRLFDDGVGFRYEWPKQVGLSNLEIVEELTEFNMPAKTSAWWIPAYEREHYEYLYRKTSVSDMEMAHTPATFEMQDGTHVSIHEAALVDFSSMTLAAQGNNQLKADLTPWSDGMKVKAVTPHHSPWRTIQIADNAGGLIESNLILNLNEPSKLEDTSWIKPGKYIGIWWEMHLAKATWGSGEKHGATTENAKRYLDFAAKNGFDGVLIEGWNKGWDGDWIKNGEKFTFTEPYEDFDIEAVSEYALSKGVRLIGHHETGGATQNYERQMKDAFEMYARLGVRAVKTGYVNYADNLPRYDEVGTRHGEWHYGQYMVQHHQRVIEQAAKNKIMIDVHEPVKQTGLRRTYPNMMTAEGARGQEYNAWSSDGGNPPDHTTIIPFTRLLAGPMDFTPGIFKLEYPEYRPNNQVNTTLAKQLALYVVLYSPLQMAADLPEHYESYDDALQFIRDVPADWDETIVLNGVIGDYVTIARRERGGNDWFIGSVTDEEARTLEVELSFLEPEQKYIAEIYRDADDADWNSNPTAYKIEKQIVDHDATLAINLAAGGGQAIRLYQLTSDEITAIDRAEATVGEKNDVSRLISK